MRRLKNKVYINAIVLFLTFTIVYSEVAIASGSNRIYPSQKVTIFNGDQKVGVYTREAPFPEGAKISTTGRCAIKLGDLFLVG